MKRKTSKTRRSPRGRPPAEDVVLRTNRLLDAATEAFLEHGFAGASIHEIARRAGASKQTLYARYATKSQLFTALMERKSSQIFDAICPLNSDRPVRETLVRFCSELLGMILTDTARGLHRLVIAECLEFPELGKIFWNLGPGKARTLLVEYLREQHARGTVRCEDADRAVEVLFGLLVSPAVLRATLGLRPFIRTRAEVSAWVNCVVDLFLTTIQLD